MRSRGLALVELLLAIAITSMITAAVAGITTAVARSQEFENDRRESTVRAQAVNARLAGYITPSLCILNATPSTFVLWLDDSRLSQTVHGTEIRWFSFNSLTGTLELKYVDFPAGWTQEQKDEYDVVWPNISDWWTVLSFYEGLGFISTIRLSDGVAGFAVDYDSSTTKNKKILTFTTTFTGKLANHDVVTSSSVREYQEPIA